jgi:tetratricopeptide (TPR) repeat protein
VSEETSIYIARPSDVENLQNYWQGAISGKPHFVRLQSPFGGGRRAVVTQFLQQVERSNEEAIIWRVNCLDQENGIQWLVRLYGSLIATLSSDILRRGKIEMLLNAQLPQQPQRVQTWYQNFIATLKEAKLDSEKGQVKLQLPKDNPLIGLVEIVIAIARKSPILLEIQNPHAVNSLILSSFLEALRDEAHSSSASLLAIVFDEPETELKASLWPLPLLNLFERRESAFDVQVIEPWGVSETQAFLDSKKLTGNAKRISEIASGRPGYIAELVEILTEQERLDGDLSAVTLASLAPMQVNETELDVPNAEPKDAERKHATIGDTGRIVYLAALLGQAFPSNLVADMGGYDRDSVDDMLDALEELFEEVQYSEELGTWIYKFKRGSWREGILEHNRTDDGKALAQRVGAFMERFLVPRGYGFIVKTARVYAENGVSNRAALMRSLALSNDAPDSWGLIYDFCKYFDEIEWPKPMLRTVYMNLIDRLVSAGPVPAAERVHNEVTEWASQQEDRELTAWLLFAGSRLDLRRQDLYRSRDRANDAISLYNALEKVHSVAEIHNHLASVELQDGKPEVATEHIKKALELGQIAGPDGQSVHIPGILANSEYLKGLVVRRSGKPAESAKHFQKANEIAGTTGMANLALDAGLAFGEALLASKQTDKARNVLSRVLQIAQRIRNPVRERATCELLAQAEGASQNYDAASKLAARTLQLSQALKFERALPVDLYNLGFFHYANQKPSEALGFFQQSAEKIGSMGNHPVVKELFYFMGLAHLRTGDLNGAKQSLLNSLGPAQQAKDWRKMVSSLDNLATIEEKQGNDDVARKFLNDAIDFAKQADLKEERKSLQRRLKALGA